MRRAWVELWEELPPRPSARVLDLGCGTGSFAVLLGHEVVGVDVSPRMLQRAEGKTRQHGVEVDLRLGDAGAPPVDGPSDALVVRHVLRAQAFIERQHARAATGQGWSFAIADATSDRGVGQIGLWPLGGGRAGVGHWVVTSARHRRIATHALAVVSGWGLGMAGSARLELHVEPWNEGSWRTAEEVGYQREGLLRSWQEVGGERRDVFTYSLLSPRPSRTLAG